jgi:uncharacterized membrane protein
MVWAAVIPLAAFAASRPDLAPAAYAFVLGVYAIGHVICHQLPVRSFHLWSVSLPVCARCTGIYAGAAATSLALVSGIAGPTRPERAPDNSVARTRRLLFVVLVPTALTLAYEWTTGIMPSNWIRALAGFPLGAAAAWLIGTVNLEQ